MDVYILFIFKRLKIEELKKNSGSNSDSSSKDSVPPNFVINGDNSIIKLQQLVLDSIKGWIFPHETQIAMIRSDKVFSEDHDLCGRSIVKIRKVNKFEENFNFL